MKLIAITATVLCVAASGTFAKGHNQGDTSVPGAVDVGSRTVSGAQANGEAKGNQPADKGPSESNPAADKAGR